MNLVDKLTIKGIAASKKSKTDQVVIKTYKSFRLTLAAMWKGPVIRLIQIKKGKVTVYDSEGKKIKSPEVKKPVEKVTEKESDKETINAKK